MPKVSIIVPIFGVEKYIERCARSLFCQTLPEIEFIFVNDCTLDSSMSILKRIIDEYPNREVTIINHERNLGLPSARKTGLDIASGEYIMHCDSDDWIEPDCCRIAYNVAKESNADVVVFKNWIDDGNYCFEDNSYNDTLLTDRNTAISAAISLKSSPYVWNKLVRRDIYENSFVFPKHNLAEDWVMCVQFAYRSKKTVCIDNRLYHYFRNAGSIMRVVSKDACLKRCADEHANVSLICKWLETKGIMHNFRWEIVRRKTAAKDQLSPIISDAYARKLWRKTFPEINYTALFCPYLGKRYKIRHVLLVTGLYMPLKKLSNFNFTQRMRLL